MHMVNRSMLANIVSWVKLWSCLALLQVFPAGTLGLGSGCCGNSSLSCVMVVMLVLVLSASSDATITCGYATTNLSVLLSTLGGSRGSLGGEKTVYFILGVGCCTAAMALVSKVC